jgi:hypothetical protein
MTRFVVFTHRIYDSEGYLIVMNVGGSVEQVDLSVFSAGKNELTVVTAAPNSRFDVG